MSFDHHIQTQVNEANKIMGLIRRNFTCLDKRIFTYLYKALALFIDTLADTLGVCPGNLEPVQTV